MWDETSHGRQIKRINIPLTDTGSREQFTTIITDYTERVHNESPGYTTGMPEPTASDFVREYYVNRTRVEEKRELSLITCSPKVAIWTEDYNKTTYEKTDTKSDWTLSWNSGSRVSYDYRNDRYSWNYSLRNRFEAVEETTVEQYEERLMIMKGSSVSSLARRSIFSTVSLSTSDPNYLQLTQEDLPVDLTIFTTLYVTDRYESRELRTYYYYGYNDPRNTGDVQREYAEISEYSWVRTQGYADLKVNLFFRAPLSGIVRKYTGNVIEYESYPEEDYVVITRPIVRFTSVEQIDFSFWQDASSVVTELPSSVQMMAFTPDNCNAMFLNYLFRQRLVFSRFVEKDGATYLYLSQRQLKGKIGYIEIYKLESDRFVYEGYKEGCFYPIGDDGIYPISSSGLPKEF